MGKLLGTPILKLVPLVGAWDRGKEREEKEGNRTEGRESESELQPPKI